MYDIEIDVPLIGKCNISLENEKLWIFTKRQFSHYLLNSSNRAGMDRIISVVTCENERIRSVFAKYCELETGLSGSDRWDNNSIDLDGYRYSVLDNGVSITRMRENSVIGRIKRWIHRILAVGEERKYAYLSGEFYKNVLIPLMSIYAGTYGMYCIHGSLLRDKNGKCIIISGLDGVGKSTLSEILCKDLCNSLLSDNIVLFDGENALNFVLAMRLDHNSKTVMKKIYKNKNIIEVIPAKTSFGICLVEHIYNIMLKKNDSEIDVYSDVIDEYIWLLYLQRAPEVAQINRVMTYWSFLYRLLNKSECEKKLIPITCLSVPKGKLEQAKSVICDV